jgi:hypothetical protein
MRAELLARLARRGARYGTLGGGTTETLRDLIGKRIMDAAEAGAELLAYDMMTGGVSPASPCCARERRRRRNWFVRILHSAFFPDGKLPQSQGNL